MRVEIDLEFGSEWQKDLHLSQLKMFLFVLKESMEGNNPFAIPQASHRHNKLEFKVIEDE